MVAWVSHIWQCKCVWVPLVALLAPISLVVDFEPDMEAASKCAYVIIVMAVLWLTEAIPIAVTCLFPIFMFPLLGVATAKDISGSYVSDTTMLFLGSLIIAMGLEETGLHVRISLCVMRIVGTKPLSLMAGVMGTTWFLSMWVSNTATVSMMIPIIKAIIKTMEDLRSNVTPEQQNGLRLDSEDDIQTGRKQTTVIDGEVNTAYISSDETNGNAGKYTLSTDGVNVDGNTDKGETPETRRLAKGLALAVAYGANIGGIATLTGTPPNLVFKDRAEKLYESHDSMDEFPITFDRWMGFAFPLSLLCAFLGWVWLSIFFVRNGCCKTMEVYQKKEISQTIKEHIRKLGRISMAEVQVLCVFIILVILWLFRAPPNISGWGEVPGLKKKYVSDSTGCILLSVLLFILPKEVPQIFCWYREGTPRYTPILTWQLVARKVPWGIVLLLGAGFSLARASKDSGLSAWVGNELKVFADQEDWILNLIISVIIAGATEIFSNTATVTLLMPILESLGISLGIHPLYLMITATIACSFAFMLPVATPPNAIVFAAGYLTIPDMVLAGLPMNIIAVLTLNLAINTWGKSLYNLDEFPAIFANTTVP